MADGRQKPEDSRPLRVLWCLHLTMTLSRIFNADAVRHQAGWTAYLHYGIDTAFALDVRQASTTFK